MVIIIVFVVQQIEGKKKNIIHDTKSDEQINFP